MISNKNQPSYESMSEGSISTGSISTKITYNIVFGRNEENENDLGRNGAGTKCKPSDSR